MLTVYTKKNCKWCTKVKRFLTDRGVFFQEKVYLDDFTREDIVKLLNRDGPISLPQVFSHDGKLIGTYEDTVKYFEIIPLENK